MWTAQRWFALLCAATVWLGLPAPTAAAHDLAIDQLALWPDPQNGVLRGEVLFDPELTRAKGAPPTEKDHVRVRGLLADQLRVEVDGDELSINFVVRELWSPGGATAGDLVVFAAALPDNATRLRVFAGPVFPALVVSVNVPRPEGGTELWSWLLRGSDWTPTFALQSDASARARDDEAWRRGGPELFSSASADDPARSTGDATVAESSASFAARFARLGYGHILPAGFDHLLFVAGLVLGAARRTKHIVIAITCFTIGHSLTLGLAQFEALRAPPHVVEPLIALSIVLVGLDNLRLVRAQRPPARGRYALALAFGLIHGLGFANALAELDVGSRQLIPALFSFNLGVELGQLTFAVPLILALRALVQRPALSRRVITHASLGVAAAGMILAAVRWLS